MSSSVWSINSELSSSSLSWEEECDEESEKQLQNLLESIDKVVFFDEEIPSEFSNELSEECLIWRNKFAKKNKNCANLKVNDKNIGKMKSLSAPKNGIKLGSQPRSLSEQTFILQKPKLESIPNKSNDKKDMQNGTDRHFLLNRKPLFLPPIINVNNSKRNQKQNNITTVPKVPNISKIFPKPPPVLTIEQILSRSRSIEENVPKIPILPQFNNKYKKTNIYFDKS